MILYDSDNPDSIPSGVWAAGYVDGYAAPAWRDRGFSRFPDAKRIAVFGQTDNGDVLDVERGNATPSEAPQWVQWRLAAGVKLPWVYVNRSNRSAVESALSTAGITASQVALWVATLDGTATVPVGPYPVAAVQYLNSLNSGGHYDLSIVSLLFAAPGGSLGGDTMTMIRLRVASGTEYLFSPEGRLLVGIPDAASADALPAPISQVSDAFLANVQASLATIEPAHVATGKQPITLTGTVG